MAGFITNGAGAVMKSKEGNKLGANMPTKKEKVDPKIQARLNAQS